MNDAAERRYPLGRLRYHPDRDEIVTRNGGLVAMMFQDFQTNGGGKNKAIVDSYGNLFAAAHPLYTALENMITRARSVPALRHLLDDEIVAGEVALSRARDDI